MIGSDIDPVASATASSLLELMENRCFVLHSCDSSFLSYSVPIIQGYDFLSLTNCIYLLLEINVKPVWHFSCRSSW